MIERLPEFNTELDVVEHAEAMNDKINELVDAVNRLEDHTHAQGLVSGHTSSPWYDS